MADLFCFFMLVWILTALTRSDENAEIARRDAIWHAANPSSGRAAPPTPRGQ